jgi:chromate transporter
MRVGKRALMSRGLIAVAALAFIGIFAFGIPFPLIVLVAALTGYCGSRLGLQWFKSASHGAAKEDSGPPALIDAMFARGAPEHVRPTAARFTRVLIASAVVWLGPLVALLYLAGPTNVFTSIAAFNSKMAVVTFGGAYAVLAYMAQQTVEQYHWLKPGEMLVGLGFAETTPGPLISVVQFVGFLAAFRQPSALDPALAGVLGGFLAMWSTFVPPFIWIFLGGPYVEMVIGNKSLNAALSAITAAVLGVILNLAVWFGLHTIFAQVATWGAPVLSLPVPVLSTINWPALVLASAAIIAMFRFGVGMLPTFAACAALGVLYYLGFGVL